MERQRKRPAKSKPVKSGRPRQRLFLLPVLIVAGIALIFILRDAEIEPEHAASTSNSVPTALSPPALPMASETKETPARIDRVRIVPETVYPGTMLHAEITFQPPEKPLAGLEYQWVLNGEMISGAFLTQLDTSPFRKGDSIRVAVAPVGGEVNRQWIESEEVIIRNRPPEIVSLPTTAVADGLYVYQVTASDPDGDPLVYSLEQAPEGMSIDSATGRIKWSVPSGNTGAYPVSLVVSDGTAGAYQKFTLSLTRNP